MNQQSWDPFISDELVQPMPQQHLVRLLLYQQIEGVYVVRTS